MNTNVPPFIVPQDVSGMSDEQLRDLVESVRVQRLLSYRHYEEGRRMAVTALDERLRGQLEKKCGVLLKQIHTIDKSLKALQKKTNAVLVIRAEINELAKEIDQ